MKHFVLNENRIFDLWEYIWLEISTALPHSNCQLHRAVYASLPPLLLLCLKKKGHCRRKKSRQGKRQKTVPPSYLKVWIRHCEGGINLLPTKPHNRTTTSAGRGMRLSVQAGKLK